MPNLRKQHMHRSSTMSVPRKARFACIADVRQSKISETLKRGAREGCIYGNFTRHRKKYMHVTNKTFSGDDRLRRSSGVNDSLG